MDGNHYNQFQLTDQGSGNQVSTLVRTKNYFNLAQMSSGWLINTTYDVSVRAMISGIWTSYGNSCPITTPAIASKAILAFSENGFP